MKRAAALVLVALLGACGDDRSRTGQSREAVAPRYALANGCYELRSVAAAALVGGGPFFMKPTALGRYLFFDSKARFLAADGSEARSHAGPSDAAEWTIDTDSTGAFTIVSTETGKALAVAPASTALVLVDGTAGDRSRFGFEPTTGCAEFPEITVDATGEPFKGRGVDQPALGFADSHNHLTATDFLGGAHYGRPFHRFGVTEALKDCSERHGPDGIADVVGNFLLGTPVSQHDTKGWPTFAFWPQARSLTHEGLYYKWLERAWRSGLRLFVNHLVQNEVLCTLERNAQGKPLDDCNEMDAARLQVTQIRDLESYIDAQEGGPGRGWFRIVTSPAEARRVIDDGKLAVVLGIEVSHLFDCALKAGIAQCDEATIDRELDEFYGYGVRAVFPVHEFDNAYGGNGIFRDILNVGNFIDTQHFWDTYECPDQPYLYGAGTHLTGVPLPENPITQAIDRLTGGPLLPIYDPARLHCNARWMTPLGRYLVQRLMAKKVMIEIDHTELAMKSQILDIAEAASPPYPVMSGHGGHGGLSEDQARRIFAVGGLVYDYKGNGTGYVEALRRTHALAGDQFYFGFGYGADTNGLGAQASPRAGDVIAARPVRYPFTLFRGPDWGSEFDEVPPVTFERQRSGVRVYDTDVDGHAHYGLTADFVEEVRLEGGEEALHQLFRSAEAYIRMWERVVDR